MVYPFPHRTGDMYKYDLAARPQVWNHGISGLPNVLAHYRADHCWSDLAKTMRAVSGDVILVVEDLSGNGRDCIGNATYPSLDYVTDHGHPAIQTRSSSTERSFNYEVKTTQAFAATCQVVAFRSLGNVWSFHGAVLGITDSGNTNTARNYLFDDGAYGLFNGSARTPRLRVRGYDSPSQSEAWTDSCAIFDIAQPCVATIWHKNPSQIKPWQIGAQSDWQRYVCGLAIYEAVLLSSDDIDEIKFIEDILLDRYFYS